MLGTKAETLENLQQKVFSATILPQIRFTISEWKKQSALILEKIRAANWAHIPLIIRSSAHDEDGSETSLAGRYFSKLNCLGEESIILGVDEVINAMFDEHHQIFIQPMLQSVKISGVAFSCDPNTLSPYYVINYDDETGKTDSITSGHGSYKTFIYVKHSKGNVPTRLQSVIALLSELESLTKQEYLDIEFAVDSLGKLYLLQVRPLILSAKQKTNAANLHDALTAIENQITRLSAPHPYLYGKTTVFGVMPDWNPAEIIGIRPKPLALSLYRELITDTIWAYQRDNYGYRNLRSFPLIVDFHGLPYIDVRVSFNSFIPNGLDPALSERLVNYYIDRLIQKPSLHDKVEFEILFSCYTLDIEKRIRVLTEHGFDKADQDNLSASLRELTNTIIHDKKGLWLQDLNKIQELEQRRKKIIDSSLDPLGRIYWLLEDCKRYGTLPFAGLARAGFIAVQLMRSLVTMDVLKKEEYDLFMNSLDSVSSKMNADLFELSRERFLEKYGHLRPGTYDILSPRYDEAPEEYFNFSPRHHTQPFKSAFKLSLHQLKQIEALLKKHGINHDILSFLDFIKSGIEGREYAKFVFTHSLSDALSLIKHLAAQLEIPMEDCPYINIKSIYELYSTSQNSLMLLKKSIAEGRNKYSVAKKICLPSLIINSTDVWSFHLQKSEPNYITQKTAQGPVASIKDNCNYPFRHSGNFTHGCVKLSGIQGTTRDGELGPALSRGMTGCVVTDNLAHAIVFIPSADPGYDWIFSKNIAGLITQYGGANSHMAIRAGELGIPAVIGAGETLYNQWKKAEQLKIDCANKQVTVIV